MSFSGMIEFAKRPGYTRGFMDARNVTASWGRMNTFRSAVRTTRLTIICAC